MMKKKLIGVGGVGKGIFFESLSNETLGRNESRLMRRLACRDYCKLHIVFHYAARLLEGRCSVLPVALVGRDGEGGELSELMRSAGMDLRYMKVDETLPTMLSICFQYPDKSGGNITSSNSACSRLTAETVAAACRDCGLGKGDYAAALPEAPVEARLSLLREAHGAGAFCTMSFAPDEAVLFRSHDIMRCCDLLALNQEEARRFAELPSEIGTLKDAQQAAEKILARYPHLHLWLTVGSKGSISADGDGVREYLPLPVTVRNTGGAGDATLGGILAGLMMGMPFQRTKEAPSWGAVPIGSAAELGAILGGLSVECEDSIDQRLSMEFVKDYIAKNGWTRSF